MIYRCGEGRSSRVFRTAFRRDLDRSDQPADRPLHTPPSSPALDHWTLLSHDSPATRVEGSNFRDLCDEGQRLEREGQAGAARACYEKALRLL